MKSEMDLRGLKISPENLRGRKFFGQKIRGAKNLGHFPENTPGGYLDLIVSTPLEKLKNQNLYRKLPEDPTQYLHTELY